MNIDKLLNKQGWTGEELGRLELANTFTSFSQALQGVENSKVLISKTNFQKMINTIRKPEDISTYNNFLKIHNWIGKNYNIAIAHEQQAQLSFSKLLNIIANAMVAENLYKYIENLPAIMTEKEYKDLIASRTEEVLKPDGREIGFNIFNLLEQALYYYINQLQLKPNKKNLLNPLKGKLEKELVTDPRILSRYSEVMGRDKPEALNKWEILQVGDLFEYYPALAGNGTNEEQLADIEAFKKEFPEVVAILLKDMELFIKGISSIPTKEWLDKVYMWEDLYKNDFYGFRKDYVNNDTTIFNGNYRAIFNGIAILRPSDLLEKSPCINNKGYYKAPEPMPMKYLSLEKFFTESESYNTETSRVEEERETFRKSIYYILGYNKALELVAKKYKVEEIVVAQIPFKGMIERVIAFNQLVENLYSQIKDTHYEDIRLQEKKLEVLKDILYPIDDSFLVIPEERIVQANKVMKDFKAFKNSNYDLCAILCTIPEEM